MNRESPSFSEFTGHTIVSVDKCILHFKVEYSLFRFNFQLVKREIGANSSFMEQTSAVLFVGRSLA